MAGPPSRTQTLVREGDELKLRSQRLRLEVTAGPSSGVAKELDGPDVRIGTGKSCELLLKDPAVSRHHLTLQVEPRGLRVIDAGSRNGTRLDGVAILDAFARSGSCIEIGQSTLRVGLLDETVDSPLYAGEQFGALLGRSVPMRRLFSRLERAAKIESTILIEGETGTGKELIAEAIHDASPRREGPFVVLDCSAVSPTLVDSELFGHARGAFTGAVSARPGVFEAADSGTVFLDEIGELPLDLQPRLLRAIERGQIRPVGANAAKAVDVRVLAATHRNLEAEVEAGRFREDLYYRLAVVRVTAPPLRERTEDIALLAESFAARLARRVPGTPSLSPRLLRDFAARSWPGNVRELRNAVERALAMGEDSDAQPATSARPSPVALAAAGSAINSSIPLKTARDEMLERFEAAYVRAVLDQAEGNVTRAAEIAGVHRRFIHRAIQRYGLR